LGQFILYGPSLLGRKVLLPLDILAQNTHYLPRTPETQRLQVRNFILSDLVHVAEPARRFAVSEYHAGRLPMWTPYHVSGAGIVHRVPGDYRLDPDAGGPGGGTGSLRILSARARA